MVELYYTFPGLCSSLSHCIGLLAFPFLNRIAAARNKEIPDEKTVFAVPASAVFPVVFLKNAIGCYVLNGGYDTFDRNHVCLLPTLPSGRWV
jgi:hypothetical protein